MYVPMLVVDPRWLIPEHLQQGSEPTTPFFISALGRVHSTWLEFRYILIKPVVHTALDFRKWLGGEVKINAYCRDLAIRGGKRLAEIFGTEEMDETPLRELTLNMVQKLLTRQRTVLKVTLRSM